MPKEIEAFKLLSVSNLSNITNMNEILDNILIPRVVGSVGHKKVNKYIKQTLSSLGWQVDVDQFQDKTPNMGTLTFENIIATLNPNAKKFLILACHYDSKYFKNEEFLGATDSAGICPFCSNSYNSVTNCFVFFNSTMCDVNQFSKCNARRAEANKVTK